MGKKKPQVVLKRVFQDISNISNVIEDSKKVEESFKEANFDDEKESDKIIDSTKDLIDRLKQDIIKISEYFDKNYSIWHTVELRETNEVSNDLQDSNKMPEVPTNIEILEKDTVTNETGSLNVNEVSAIVNGTNEESDKENDASNEADTTKDTGSQEPQTDLGKSNENSEEANKDVNNDTNSNHDNMETECTKINNEGSPEAHENDNTKPDEETSAIKKETKVFLKCIDINKLKDLPKTGGDDSVLIISDSEPENDKSTHKKSMSKNKSVDRRSTRARLTIDAAVKKIGGEVTIVKKINNMTNNTNNGDVQIVEVQNNANKNKEIPRLYTVKSNRNNTEKVKSSKNKVKDSLKVTDLCSTDNSSSEVENPKSNKNIPIAKLKVPKCTPKEKVLLDAQSDKKFSCKTYVPLPRYPCEKLKGLYLKKLEHGEVKRLTDLSNLKKRKRTKDNKESNSSSSDREKRRMRRRKRQLSNDSHSSNDNKSDVEFADAVMTDKDLHTDELPEPSAKDLLNDTDSVADVSPDENAEKKKKKVKSAKSKKKKSSSEDESSDNKKKKKKSSSDSSDSDKKKKSKWRKDKLLKKKVVDSDSDSEDELEKFKKQKEKAKYEVKKKLVKKKLKKVIASDSESGSDFDSKKKKKKKSESDKSSDSSSSSSSESDSDNRSKKYNKKGGRIKRMKSSSSSSGEDKSTRKSIRKVLGEDSLQETTKQAEKDEIERKARIAERQKKYNAIFDKNQLEDASIEKVVLDFDEKTKKELLSVHEELVAKLKPHQAKGIQFMWNACFESLERIKGTNGSGCILAHCMGLGKTLQVIALIHTLILNAKTTEVKKVMVVCPVNTVLNWVDEFKKWLSELEDKEEIEIYELVSNKQNSYREYLVKKWTKHGGVLIIGYDMFRNITNPVNKRLRKQMRDVFQKGMVDPGPDLIVCDEGHLLKNEKTNLSVAISRVRTERRIVLTGTPMQNNLKEYYCMVQFVKPNLLGTYKEYLNRFVNPITNGQYTDSTPHDISIMKKRSHVLHKMLDGIVQRKDYDVLAPFLPPKFEYVLFTKLSEIQIKLYQHYLDNFARKPMDSKLRRTAFLFSDFQELQRICTHPRILLVKTIETKKKNFFKESSEDSEGSLKDFIDDGNDKSDTPISSSSSSSSDSNSDSHNGTKKKKAKEEKSNKPAQRLTRTAAAAASIEVTDIIDDDDVDDGVSGWWRQIISADELENIALGGKIFLLFEILQQCEVIGDKILIFSQSLYSLNIIEYFLGKIDEATQDGKNADVCGFSGSWAAGLDYFRIDGSSSCDNRAAWCKSFNSPDNHRARLFLISTKAGGLGINLTGANRVIIFDVSWNPSHDVQSIYRVYRFGQTKPCYIYRFVAWGTMEMKIYERQVTKQAISKRVIDEQQIDRHYNQNDLAELYNFDPNPTEAPTPLLPKDILLAELLQSQKDKIYKYHEHQSLLENKEGEELDEAERKAAWEEYEHEKTNPTPSVSANTTVAGGWIRNLPVTSITAALLNILQRDNPTWTREQVQAVIPIVVQQLRDQVDIGELLLFNRIVNELRLMQVQQQQKLQQYYLQQQMRMLQQQQQQGQTSGRKPSGMGGVAAFRSVLQNALNSSGPMPNPAYKKPKSRTMPEPPDPNEIVDLND